MSLKTPLSSILRQSLPTPSSSTTRTSTHLISRSVSTRSRTPHDPDHSASARIYTPRKSYLYQSYTHLLNSNQVVLLFQPNNLDSKELAGIRKAIKGVPLPRTSVSSPSSQSPSPSPTQSGAQEDSPAAATLTLTRTGLLSSVSRTLQPQLLPLLNGPTALITIPSLSPPYIQRILAAVHKSLKFRSPASPSVEGQTSTSSRLILLGGLVEGTKILSAQEIMELLQLPDLDTLRGQLVGMLEMPARQLVGVTQMAGGGVGWLGLLWGWRR